MKLKILTIKNVYWQTCQTQTWKILRECFICVRPALQREWGHSWDQIRGNQTHFSIWNGSNHNSSNFFIYDFFPLNSSIFSHYFIIFFSLHKFFMFHWVRLLCVPGHILSIKIHEFGLIGMTVVNVDSPSLLRSVN